MRVQLLLAVAVTLAGVADARAQDGGVVAGEPPDDDFGPAIVIEDIEVVGNRSTIPEVIVRALPLAPGDALRAGDRRLRDARIKLLALGFFREVTLALRKGSAPGQVVLTVTVVERGTVVLNRLWFGTSVSSVGWVGADIADRNFLGTGLSLGGGFVYAASGDVAGSRDQWAGEVRVADPSLLGTPYGVRGSFTWTHGSEPYRIGGASDDDGGDNYLSFPYQRIAVRGGATWDATAFTSFALDLRVETIDADLPVAPTRTLEDGRAIAVDLHLRPDSSEVVSVAFGLDRDSRSDPVLPRSGSRFSAQAELGSTLLGGSYDFASILSRYERWWPAGSKAALGLRLSGGVVLGDPTRFDLIHVADVNHLMVPRALGLTVSAERPPDLLRTGTGDLIHGEVGGNAMLEYRRRLFRRSKTVYGGDWFVGAGVWALSTRDDLALRDEGVWRALPVDLMLDAGLRVDTEIGVFELTIANGLGRVQL